jgi:hypothetical protein
MALLSFIADPIEVHVNDPFFYANPIQFNIAANVRHAAAVRVLFVLFFDSLYHL